MCAWHDVYRWEKNGVGMGGKDAGPSSFKNVSIVSTVWVIGGDLSLTLVQAGMDHPSEAVTGEAKEEGIEQQIGDETIPRCSHVYPGKD